MAVGWDVLRGEGSGPAAANAAQTLTIPGVRGRRLKLAYVSVSYSAAPTGGRCTVVESSGQIVFDGDVTAAGITALWNTGDGPACSLGQSATITLSAGGAAVVGKINAGFVYVPGE